MSTQTPASQSSTPTPHGRFDRYFHITERGSSIGREVRGGLATFFAMSYIIVLNPLIIGASADSTGNFLGGGSEPNLPAVAAATSLISGLMTILMGVIGKFPMAVSSSLGLSAFITYGIVVLPGMTWADAMGLVVIEGFILLILVLTGFRSAIFNAVPGALKTAISVGIGLFIALIGMVNAGFIQNNGGTGLELGVGGSLYGWPILIFLIAMFALFAMWAAKIRGAILYSIVGATVLAITLESVFNIGPQIAEDGTENPYGWGLTVPTLNQDWLTMPDLSLLGDFNLLGSWQSIGVVAATLAIFTLLLANFFDLLGTMVGVSNAGGIKDADGDIPHSRRIMVADAVGTIGGGVGSTSVNSGLIESTVGVGDGARTGLANVVTGVLFLATIVLAPLAAVIPTEAASATLVLVGFLMMQQIVRIDWTEVEMAIPAFMTIVVMPFSYSITNGIGAGFISYVAIKVFRGKWGEVHPLMYVTAVLFVLYFVSGPIQSALGVG
ncbi:NCS2 family permease [Nesterenkonia halotolerans]|uniref:AGZA family xanthine/uracil permease-like MFS transporter n=1 Tax=Nesterenkonia halotolerans TaxID=225325 RepID=A0ABR9J412_9MICC|nr:NCS2 family permease [Nesterenkonia halotolerans]MBE1513733.1 AGZA family xanthine/uracil permease-like MFS transporter [Nesterenkonia halotolerans]